MFSVKCSHDIARETFGKAVWSINTVITNMLTNLLTNNADLIHKMISSIANRPFPAVSVILKILHSTDRNGMLNTG